MLVWVEGAPRGPLVGQSIAWVAGRGQHGVDGQAAGGFEKRSPFRDARFTVAGEGAASGDWRISGIPFFDAASGTFQGYRGTARRPRPDEVARSAADDAEPGVFGTEFPADSLRQLIHELRTPLNAIIGFAEMIEGQYLGPAAMPYRGRAATIMEQARGLLGAVDDLDTAARIEIPATRARGRRGGRRRPARAPARKLRTGRRPARRRDRARDRGRAAPRPGRGGRRRADVRPPVRRDDRSGRGRGDDRR